METTVVRIEDLEKIFRLVIEKLKHDKILELRFDSDFYRFISADEWSNFTTAVIEIGSLKDDVQSLLMLVNDQSRPCTYVDFDRLASLLRATSQKCNPV